MRKMNRRDFMRLAVGGTAFAAMDGFSNSPLLGKDRKDRPNILFIMSDDHAAQAISAYGGFLSDVAKTPNIDRIAKEGMRFDNCFCTNQFSG